MSKSRFAAQAVLFLVLALVNVVMFNALLGDVHRQLDLTEDQRFTLRPVTVETLNGLEETVTLHFYYTGPDKQYPGLRPLIQPLTDILRSYERAGGGKVRLVRRDMTESSDEEREEVRELYGVFPAIIPTANATESTVRDTYFHLVISGGGRHLRYGINGNAEEFFSLLTVHSQAGRAIEDQIELGDIERLLTLGIQRITRSFDDPAAALAEQDLRAEVTYFVNSKAESAEETRKEITAATDALARRAGGRITYKFEDPFEGIEEDPSLHPRDRIMRKALFLEERYGIRALINTNTLELQYAGFLATVDGKRVVGDLLEGGQAAVTRATVTSRIESVLRMTVPGMRQRLGLAIPAGDRTYEYLEDYLGQDYQVERVTLPATPQPGATPPPFPPRARIPRGVNALVLLRPVDFTRESLEEIDQFLMRGGRLFVAFDLQHFDEQMYRTTSSAPGLVNLLESYGFRVQDKETVLDERCSVVRTVDVDNPTDKSRYFEQKLPFCLRIAAEQGDRDLFPSGQGVTMLFPTPVSIDLPEGSPGEGRVVVRSSRKAAAVEENPMTRQGFTAEETLTEGIGLAALYRGPLETAFPEEGADRDEGDADGEGAEAEGTPAGESAEEPDPEKDDPAPSKRLARSISDPAILVLGDAEFLNYNAYQLLHPGAVPGEFLERQLGFFRNALSSLLEDDQSKSLKRRAIRRPLSRLEGKTSEERQATARRLTLGAFVITAAGVLLFAVAWFTLRALSGTSAAGLLPAEKEETKE